MTWLDEWAAGDGSLDLAKVYREFGDHVFRRTAAHNGLAGFVAEVGFSGRHCVEIGTFRGLTASILARRFEAVTAIDILDEPLRRAVLRHLGIRNVAFRRISKNWEKAELLKGLEFDAAYVDGDHDDAAFDFGLVERCGRVLFHEYWPAKPQVWDLVNRLRDRGDCVTVFRNFALWQKA